MEADRVIHLYIADVVRRLPRRQRADIASELSALIAEGLADRAEAAGGAPDEQMALELLRDFGRPREVAARYQPPATIIDPSDTRDFVLAALIGSAILWRTSLILSWLGLLVLFFGARSWVERRRPVKSPWHARDPDEASRARYLARAALIALGLLCLVAPGWVYLRLSGGQPLPARLDYTAAFYHVRLPWLLAVGLFGALLYVAVAIRGRWQLLTRRIDIGLYIALVGVLSWFRDDGNLFHAPMVDRAARIGIEWALFLVMMAIVLKACRLQRLRI